MSKRLLKRMYITKTYLSVGIKHKLFFWIWTFLSLEFSQSINVCTLLWTKFYLELVYIQISLLNCYFILKENLKLIIRPANTIGPVSLTTSPVEERRYESFRKYEEFLCHCWLFSSIFIDFLDFVTFPYNR